MSKKKTVMRDTLTGPVPDYQEVDVSEPAIEPKDIIALRVELQQCLQDVLWKARDGRGLPVRLLSGPNPPNVVTLRDTLFTMLEPVDRNAVFVAGISTLSAEETRRQNTQAEAAFWDNLALLARATAAALRVEAVLPPEYARHGGRGSGRTTRAMQNAPMNAVYVWCNDKLSYPRDLARKVGRDDLRIVGPDDIERRAPGATAILVDHAFPSAPGFVLDFLRAHRATFCE